MHKLKLHPVRRNPRFRSHSSSPPGTHGCFACSPETPSLGASQMIVLGNVCWGMGPTGNGRISARTAR